MRFEQVVRSGKFFKRPHHKYWFWSHALYVYEQYTGDVRSDNYRKADLIIEDLCAEDWVIAPSGPQVVCKFCGAINEEGGCKLSEPAVKPSGDWEINEYGP